MIAKIDRNAQLQIQLDIAKALRAVADKYGLEMDPIDVRRSTSGDFLRVMKLDMRVKAPVVKGAKSAPALGNTPLDAALKRLGITKKVNSKGQMIVDYKPSRPKYPFVVQGPKGGRWKYDEASVKLLFA